MAYTTIDNPGELFATNLFTGTGSSLGVTGTGFQPDFTWIKNRDATDFHVVTDSVRGATKYVVPNTNAASVTDTESLKSFDSDGFTVGTMAEVNTNTEKYASWNWKAGTTTGIAGSPSLTPTGYSFNQTAGCSIIGWNGNTTGGATIPHGLGVAPQFIIVKGLADTLAWTIYHVEMGATKYLVLDTYASEGTSSGKWNDTAPDATLVTLGSESVVNHSGGMVAYCFRDIKGYQRCGGYKSNANADGPYITTGFRPAFVLIKNRNGADSWVMFDDKREGQNSAKAPTYGNNDLRPDTTAVETTTNQIDIYSNGFKPKIQGPMVNAADSSNTYIYYAVAHSPFVTGTDAIPANAR